VPDIMLHHRGEKEKIKKIKKEKRKKGVPDAERFKPPMGLSAGCC
jgi:hypothetical protein